MSRDITANIKIEAPESVRLTLSVSMQLSDWRLVKKQLESAEHPTYPGRRVVEMIGDLIAKAQQGFTETSEQNDDHTTHPAQSC